METVISATNLVRKLGDVLGRLRYRGESFVIERHGVAVARLVPVARRRPVSVRAALRHWREAAAPDAAFASDLERVGTSDRVPDDPWVS
jgi:antitoxin (DNA-binding transcriptional repressor) of toxin-antitoxin stability system